MPFAAVFEGALGSCAVCFGGMLYSSCDPLYYVVVSCKYTEKCRGSLNSSIVRRCPKAPTFQCVGSQVGGCEEDYDAMGPQTRFVQCPEVPCRTLNFRDHKANCITKLALLWAGQRERKPINDRKVLALLVWFPNKVAPLQSFYLCNCQTHCVWSET
eukprot:4465133-Amphidinium_carterae.1